MSTDIFDQFIADNNLWDVALMSSDDEEIVRRFLAAEFPSEIEELLRSLLDLAAYPLAVRSSSLLEDSRYQPFAGIYTTYMLPNNHEDPDVRMQELISSVKRVYASMFSRKAKLYIKATPYRLEEEKMAVIIQKLVGSLHENRFYPDFAGAASSHNHYPIAPVTAADGVASVALGLGVTVMEGGRALRFCPRYPQNIVQFSSAEDMVSNSQKDFYALELPAPDSTADHIAETKLAVHDLSTAEKDGTLMRLASTYSIENDAVYDGTSRKGPRIVTFAPILKNDEFPLADILDLVMKFGTRGMSSPVEIEFAANVSVAEGERRQFCILQMRPMVVRHEWDGSEVKSIKKKKIVCRSSQVLGDGVVDDIQDIVYVDIERFDRSASREVALEIAQFNEELTGAGTPYILVGVGRWGTADPWLGIPVSWDDISGARVMVETSFKDLEVTPSQGTHFFQNLVSFQIGYFTLSSHTGDGFLDWAWLAEQPAVNERKFTRHVRFPEPAVVKMSGQSHEGVILKPEKS